MPERLAIFPGSFDPLTMGHVDMVRRGLRIFDHIQVAVAVHPTKRPMFSREERAELIGETFVDEPRVSVGNLSGLLVEYARAQGATAILRGLRSSVDFGYELPMVHMNYELAPTVETVFLTCRTEHSFVSSSLVKEVAAMGGDVRKHLPAHIHAALLAKLQG